MDSQKIKEMIEAKVSEIVSKIKKDSGFAAEFKKEPIAAVEKFTGIDLPDEQIKGIVEAVKAKLSLDQA